MRGKSQTLLRYGWFPLVLLLLDSIPGLLFLRLEPLTYGRFFIVIALMILLSGWLPLVLRPSPITRQAAIFAVFLAILVWMPPPNQGYNQFFDLAAANFSFFQSWRLVNALMIFPASTHLVLLFTQEYLSPNHKRGIFLIYLITIIWVTAVFLISSAPTRYWLKQGILIWNLFIMVVDIYFLIRATQNTAETNLFRAQQARSLLFFLLFTLIPAAIRFVGIFFNQEFIPYPLLVMGIAVLPFGVAFVTIRHNLFGIDALVRRAAAYTILSILVFLVTVLISVGISQNAVSRLPDYRWGVLLISLLLLSAVLSPLQKWLQTRIDRWFYPERFLFEQHIQYIQREITRVIHPREIERWLTEVLPQRIDARWAVWVPGEIPAIPSLAEEEHGWSSLVQVEAHVLGGFWLGIRRSGLPYSKDEEQQLSLLIQQAALALAYANALNSVEEINLNLEKRVAERTAQVLSQEQSLAVLTERRKIARDLHDSISQTLFSINLGARAIRKLAIKDPEIAVKELEILEQSAQTAQQEMRSLLNQLREPPPGEKQSIVNLIILLTEHIRILASQNGPDGSSPLLEVLYTGPGELWLPQYRAETLMQILREVFHNIIKHAGVRSASCRLEKSPGRFLIEIEDQGSGFTPHHPQQIQHMGLSNIRERAAVLAGTVEIESWPQQGTTVKLSIPLEESA